MIKINVPLNFRSMYIMHPFICFLYYITYFFIICIFNHPIIIILSLLFSILQYKYFLNYKFKFYKFKFYLIMCIFILFTNVFFNRRGYTIIFYLFDKPITFESFLYGIYIIIFAITTFIIFKLLDKILGRSKILYLFGKYFPQTSFLLSLTLSFFTVLEEKARNYLLIQKNREGNKKISLKNNLDIFLGFTVLSLEDSMISAEILKSKDYGLFKRSSYRNYNFKIMDLFLTFVIVFIIFIFLYIKIKNIIKYIYYDSYKVLFIDKNFILILICLLIFFIAPFLIDILGIIKRSFYRWKF